jgi:hypothetical protein
MPPQVRCNITGKFHYYEDDCDCEDIKAEKAAEFAKIRELISKPGALRAINYDAPNGPLVGYSNVLTADEATMAYESIVKLPLYGESIELETVGTTCLICGESVPCYTGEGKKICATCKKAVMYIREKFSKELCT